MERTLQFLFPFQEFRIMMDRKREMYEALTPEEQVEYKDSIRHFRHPDYAKKNGKFHDLKGDYVEYDPYSTYTSAIKKYMKDKYNISLDDTGKEKDVSSDMGTNPYRAENSIFPERKNAYRQDSLSNRNSKDPTKRVDKITKVKTSNSQSVNEDMVEMKSADKKSINPEDRGSKNQEIDDIMEAMKNPNPANKFYTKTGPAIYHSEKKEEEELRKSFETFKTWSTPPPKEHTEDLYTDMFKSSHDPMAGNPRSNSSRMGEAMDPNYLNKWKQNIKHQHESDIHTDNWSYVKSYIKINRSFLIFTCTVLITISSVIIKNSEGHDIPSSSVNSNVKKET